MITGVQGGQVVKAIPIVGINPCGTRREDLLIEPPMLPEIWIQRSLLHRMDEIAAMKFLLTGVPLDLDAVENALDRA